jgi:hypothetical protein
MTARLAARAVPARAPGDCSIIAPMHDDDVIRPAELAELMGEERLADSRVLDFWRWALGDLRMNNARGYLVEYLVAKAVGDRSRVRVE